MSFPGRNDPCPCGSGRKHKHCCLRAAAAHPTRAYTTDDRSTALEKLIRFGQRPRFAEEARFAADTFWADQPEERRNLEAEEESFVAFHSWFVFDFAPEDDSRGTIVSQFLAWPGAGLTPAERTWLQRMADSAIRLYEVQQVELDRGITLQDLATGETIWVEERLGSRQIAQWDLLAIRVITGPEGALVLEGFPYLYPREACEVILGDIEWLSRQIRRELPAADETAVYKCLGPSFHHLWLDQVVFRPAPVLMTVEGDPLEFTKVVFDCDDPATVAARLAVHAELSFDEEDGVFVWTEPDGVHDRVLGRIALHGHRLTLETTSEARAARGRALLETALGGAIQYRATAIETLDQAMAHLQPAAEPEPVMPPEAREMLTEFLTGHYRDWPDHPLPALDGRTPRHAARLKTQRAKVVALLKDLEHHMDRDRREGNPAIELGWLWNELGLERPGLAKPRGT